LRWSLRTLKHRPPGWIVAIRLGKNNETVLDHILLPSTSLGKDWLWISEEGRAARKIERFETFEELAQSLVRRVNKATRSISAQLQRSKATRLGLKKRTTVAS
jgi:hypothetical protein